MPANPKLVSYIKENIEKFPFSKLEEKILAMGHSKYQLQLALNELIYPPPPKSVKIILISGISTLAILIFAISIFKFLYTPFETKKERPLTAIRPAAYKSGLGYALLIPRGYSYLSKEENNSETLILYPKETRPPDREYDYAKTKTIKLETEKKQADNDTLKTLQASFTNKLNSRNAVFSIKKADMKYPNFQIEITSPYLLVKTAVEGKFLTYIFTAGKNDEIFDFILKNLKDAASPQIRKMQKLGRRTQTGFITKRGFNIPLPDEIDATSVLNPYDPQTEDIYLFSRSREFEDVFANADKIEPDVVYASVTPGTFTKKFDILRYETDYKDMLSETGAKHRTEWIKLSGAPALKIIHSAPTRHIEVVVFARTEIYRLWAESENELLKGLYRYLQTTVEGPVI